ncbi:hypothetical protein [Salinispora vitiensis]|uniref:hypothetical protein n=1 Tax=Salinispora vitiensis TaxID=999544 RepID=UPI0013A5AD0E|nr:hypothetical protein [Salinispora vitiensis]
MTSETVLDEPQRAVIIAALDEFYCPVQVDDIGAFASNLLPLPSPGSVVAAEASAWNLGRSGPNWICPALTNGNGAADHRYLTRSDWSLENRLITESDSKARHLWLVRVFCDQYMIAEEQGLDDLESIIARIRFHSELSASSLSTELVSNILGGADEVEGEMIEELREVAEDAHAFLAVQDRSMQRQLARDLERLGDYCRLFGNTLAD